MDPNGMMQWCCHKHTVWSKLLVATKGTSPPVLTFVRNYTVGLSKFHLQTNHICENIVRSTLETTHYCSGFFFKTKGTCLVWPPIAKALEGNTCSFIGSRLASPWLRLAPLSFASLPSATLRATWALLPVAPPIGVVGAAAGLGAPVLLAA